MKKNYLFSLLLGSALLCSCNNNDDVLGGDSNQNEGVKDAYLSLSIQLPSGSIKTRAGGVTPTPGENGDGHEIGIDKENKIASLLVFGFPQHGQGTAFKEKVEVAKLADLGAVNDVHSYKTKEPFKVSAGTYHLYVMVNPSSKMEIYDVINGEADFKNQEIKMSDIQNTANKEVFNLFPMSSADKIVETVITSAHTKSHPAFFTTQVQRMFAKVVFKPKATDDFGTATGNSKANFAKDFKFVKYGIVNQRNTAYWFRRAGTSKGNAVIGEKETGNNYVIDPIFDERVSPYNDVFAATHYWNREEASSFATYWDNVGDDNVKYCFENTMKQGDQLQGYTTGLVLKAHFTPKPELVEGGKNINLDATFFMYGDKYYATFDDLKHVLPAVESLGDFNSGLDGKEKEADRQELIKKYGDHGVKVFYKGECYYHYWIRHANNGNNSVMGIMEFATVRNNVYKMSVNSVNQPGDPIPPVTPDRPDEDTDVYLDVKVEVLPWVIRENSMDL